MIFMKTYNHEPPEYWFGGTGPNGHYNSTKKDFNAYLEDWDEFNDALEKLTGLTVTGYDPGVNLSKIVDGKYIEGGMVQLPMWFAKILIEKVSLKPKTSLR